MWQVWGVAGGELCHTLRADFKRCLSVAFSPEATEVVRPKSKQK
jgi:hypothetical protein